MNIQEIIDHPLVNLDKNLRYSNLKCVFNESVAEHSELVANLALLISFKLIKQFPKIKIDLKDITWRSVIHDWGESVTCDVTTDIKYSHELLPKILEKIESDNLNKLLNGDIELINEINNSKSTGFEGKIVELADKFQAFIKIYREYKIQNTWFWKYSILNNSSPSVIKSLDELWEVYYKPIYGEKISGILKDIKDGVNKILVKIQKEESVI